MNDTLTHYEPPTSTGVFATAPPVSSESRQDSEGDFTVELPEKGFNKESALIAIVDDEEMNIEVVTGYLETEGYQKFVTTTDSTKALEMIRRSRPDAVLLDVVMPEISGLEILASMRADTDTKHIPVVVLTACTDAETKLRALRLGPSDFLGKPVDPSELLLRIQNVLAVKAYQDQLATYSQHLEEQVRRRTAQLEASRRQIIQCLARAAEFRDNDTGHHIIRVGRYAGIIARQMGFDERWVELIEQAAQLHDVGKIGIPDGILRKEGKLEAEQFDHMKQHCGFGNSIIQPMSNGQRHAYEEHVDIGARLLDVDGYPILEMAATIAQTHHEKWDGSGYPAGLAGTQIPIEGRITAVADVYDALSSKRPYKPAFPQEKSLQIMRETRGTHFDPDVLDAFLTCIEEVTQVQQQYADEYQTA